MSRPVPLTDILTAAKACTGSPLPTRWEWAGRAHLAGRCDCPPRR